MYIKEAYERLNRFIDDIAYRLDEAELKEIGEIETVIGEYIDAHEEEDIKYFNCPHCGVTLENQRNFDPDVENQNEFWCHKCGITYIVEGDVVIEEEDPFEEKDSFDEEECKVSSLEEALKEVFDEFTDDIGTLRPWIENNDKGYSYLEDAVNNILSQHEDEVHSYNVVTETLFEKSSYTVGYISIAYTNENGELWHETHKWEVM